MDMFGIRKRAAAKAAEEQKREADLAALEAKVKGIRPASAARGVISDVNKLPPSATGKPKPAAQPKKKDEDFKDSPYNVKEQLRKRGRYAIPDQ
jgi:hypothetical protein